MVGKDQLNLVNQQPLRWACLAMDMARTRMVSGGFVIRAVGLMRGRMRGCCGTWVDDVVRSYREGLVKR